VMAHLTNPGENMPVVPMMDLPNRRLFSGHSPRIEKERVRPLNEVARSGNSHKPDYDEHRHRQAAETAARPPRTLGCERREKLSFDWLPTIHLRPTFPQRYETMTEVKLFMAGLTAHPLE
jgi:hypothetical protein